MKRIRTFNARHNNTPCYLFLLSFLSYLTFAGLLGTNSNFKVIPIPSANRFNNLRDGFLVPFSSLLISAWLIPVLSASSFWVRFCEILASTIARITSISGWISSHRALRTLIREKRGKQNHIKYYNTKHMGIVNWLKCFQKNNEKRTDNMNVIYATYNIHLCRLFLTDRLQ